MLDDVFITIAYMKRCCMCMISWLRLNTKKETKKTWKQNFLTLPI
jgi:hypothetical protein